MTTPDLPSIPIDRLPTRDVVLLDVREDDEWAAGHAPGAVHIPLSQVPARLGELDTDGEVHVICRSGGRSAQATAWLVQNGVDAVNVAGGMKAYQGAGRELVSDGGSPTVL